MAVGRTLCLLLVSAAMAAPVLAQTAPQAPGGLAGGGDHRKARSAEWEARREERDRQRAADIALLLHLRPDQQVAYQAWDASTRPPRGERRGEERERGEAASQTTAQALDGMQAGLAERDAQTRARLDATRRFYASLSPEQQALFDALMRLRRGGGEGGSRHEPHHEGGEGPESRGGMAPPPPAS